MCVYIYTYYIYVCIYTYACIHTYIHIERGEEGEKEIGVKALVSTPLDMSVRVTEEDSLPWRKAEAPFPVSGILD